MVESAHVTFGEYKSTIILLDPQLISVRLEDGSFLGPELVIQDSQYQLAENENPLNYTDQEQQIIQDRGWNVRKLDSDLESLQKNIEAAGEVLKPLSLIFAENHLFIEDGHRRHFCVSQINANNSTITKVPAVIEFDFEERTSTHRMLRTNVRHNFSPLDIGKKILKVLLEDQAKGLSPERTKEEFKREHNWSGKQYEDYLSLANLPLNLQQLFVDQKISYTAITKITCKDLTIDQKHLILTTAYTKALSKGHDKVTVKLIDETFEEFERENLEPEIKTQIINQVVKTPSANKKRKPSTKYVVGELSKTFLKPENAIRPNELKKEDLQKLSNCLLIQVPQEEYEYLKSLTDFNKASQN